MSYIRYEKMVLITHTYPFNDPKEPFIDSEVRIFSNLFSEVIIIPFSGGGVRRTLPDNVSVLPPILSKGNLTRIMRLKGLFLSFNAIDKQDLLDLFSFNFIKLMQNISELLSFNLKSTLIKNKISMLFQQGIVSNTDVFFSYWCDEGAHALTQLDIDKSIARAHRYEIYKEDRRNGYVPKRLRFSKKLNQLISISEHGKSYIYDEYGIENVTCSYLGTFYHSKVSPPVIPNTIKIVSCSFITPVKRVEKIYQAITHIAKKFPGNISWCHIGNGDMREMIQREIDDNNCLNKFDIKFIGNISNQEVNRLYTTEGFSVFINLSDSEGVPISIIEANSYGIPFVALDVGGNKEILVRDNGMILPQHASLDDIASAVIKISNPQDGLKSRYSIKEQCYSKFNLEKNVKCMLDNVFNKT